MTSPQQSPDLPVPAASDAAGAGPALRVENGSLERDELVAVTVALTAMSGTSRAEAERRRLQLALSPSRSTWTDPARAARRAPTQGVHPTDWNASGLP